MGCPRRRFGRWWCTPETATPELMATLSRGGVTRLSIGAQSFEPRHLATLERWHEPSNVARAIGLARAEVLAHQRGGGITESPSGQKHELDEPQRDRVSGDCRAAVYRNDAHDDDPARRCDQELANATDRNDDHPVQQ